MRLTKPIIAVTAVAMLALAACGGDDDGGGAAAPGGPTETSEFQEGGASGQGKDPNREAPAADFEGA